MCKIRKHIISQKYEEKLQTLKRIIVLIYFVIKILKTVTKRDQINMNNFSNTLMSLFHMLILVEGKERFKFRKFFYKNSVKVSTHFNCRFDGGKPLILNTNRSV